MFNKGITKTKDNDFILVSDLDEIPDLSKVNFGKIKNKIIIFEQKMFYYKLNLIYKETKFGMVQKQKKKRFDLSTVVEKYKT